MGNQACALPDGAAGKVLKDMTGPQHIGVTDNFWFELLKVQLPGVDDPGFFEALYTKPIELDRLVRNAYFLQLVVTNEHSGNFRTFLRFWARLLHYFQTSPRDAKPCTASTLLSLSLLCRCLLKQFAETFTAPELIFQMEQTPMAGDSDRQDTHVIVGYCGHRARIALPCKDLATLLDPLCSQFPEDSNILRDTQRCTIRAEAGETVPAGEVAHRLHCLGAEELVVCPSGVPQLRGSVLRSAFREICDFLVSSSFGAISGTPPSLMDKETDGDGQSTPRNWSLAPDIMQLQAVLLEVLLTLTAVAAPSYGPPDEQVDGGVDSYYSSPGKSFCAPYLFTARERWAAQHAAALRSGGATNVQAAPTANVKLPPTAQEEEQLPSLVPRPPGVGEEASLPLLKALLEVLEEDLGPDSVAGGAHVNGGDSGGTAFDAQEPLPFVGASGSTAPRGAHTSDIRAEAVLATLLNSVWLESYSALLIKPPREVLRLLSGVELPLHSSEVEASRAALLAATSIGKPLAIRSVLVLLLLLFHEPEAHPRVAAAFESLTDPLLQAGASKHKGAAAPINFTQLLRAVLARLQEGLYAILLYSLVLKNPSFRRYCLCRADADAVMVPMLEVLYRLPTAAQGSLLRGAPASATALTLTLLTFTGDRGFCEGASKTHVADAGPILSGSRPLKDVNVISLLVLVLLRIAHWNFSACRDPFFNSAIAGIIGNLAAHGPEQLHWHAASRLTEVSQLLAKNALRSALEEQSPGREAEQLRDRMVRELLHACVKLLSSSFKVPHAVKNCTLACALQRTYPSQFATLETDPLLGPGLRHVRAVMTWLEVQCPPPEGMEEDGSDFQSQVARLEAAATRLPSAVDALAVNCGLGFAYQETSGASAFFLPAVWRAAHKLLPEHICWSRQRATADNESGAAQVAVG